MIQTVLMIGNTLNGGTFRGDARGFQLDTLIKVSSIHPTCKTQLTFSYEIRGLEKELLVRHYYITSPRSYSGQILAWCSSSKICHLSKRWLDVRTRTLNGY